MFISLDSFALLDVFVTVGCMTVLLQWFNVDTKFRENRSAVSQFEVADTETAR
jgi:hypothetical protein